MCVQLYMYACVCGFLYMYIDCLLSDIRIPLEWKEFEQIKGKIGEHNFEVLYYTCNNSLPYTSYIYVIYIIFTWNIYYRVTLISHC